MHQSKTKQTAFELQADPNGHATSSDFLFWLVIVQRNVQCHLLKIMFGLNLYLAAQDGGLGAVPQGAGMDLADDIGGLLTAARAGCSSSDVVLQLRGPEDSATSSIPVHR